MLQTIQAKVIALLAAFFLLQGLVLIVIGAKLSGVSAQYRHMIEFELQQQRRIDTLNLAFKTQVQEWKNTLLRGHTQKDFDQYWGRFEARQREIQALVQSLATGITDAETAKTIQQFGRVHADIFAQYQQGAEVYQALAFDFKAADRLVRGLDREPSQLLESLASQINASVLSDTQALNASSDTLTTMVYTFIVMMSLSACILLALFIKVVLVGPVLKLKTSVDSMASGDFSQAIRAGGRDEVGRLSKSLNDMRIELCSMLGVMVGASHRLTDSAGVLTRAAQGIDDDTHHAQDHAGQIAAAMTQMSASIAEVASNASVAADATDQANQGAGEGMRIMEEAILAISAVADEVVKISADMTRLEQNTTSVGAVLDVIKGIAEQTNLLALNAAIEAARAGEQGRGFAVVADEVRALAKRTQESTEEIHHIIEAVQNGAKAAARGMDAGNQKTEHAVSLARDAGDAIRKIVNQIDRVQGMSSQIATAAEEQSAATEEINRNVVNMTNLSEKAHESAANTHSIATGLGGIAGELHGMVVKFTLPN